MSEINENAKAVLTLFGMLMLLPLAGAAYYSFQVGCFLCATGGLRGSLYERLINIGLLIAVLSALASWLINRARRPKL